MNGLPQKEAIDNALWDNYRQTKSVAIRNQILTDYLSIVTINAKRMSAVYKNKAELADIVNQGVIALMECIDRYDPRRGVQFATFASVRVRGSIIDYMRKQDWVPRDIRKLSRQIDEEYGRLQSSYNRPPTDEEVAESLGISSDEYHKTMTHFYTFSLVSYEEILDDASHYREPISEMKVPEQTLQEAELKKVIAGSIDHLNEQERLVVSLYYYEELKLKEIAAVLGLTASRVSQIHTKALQKMKKKLQDYMKE